jgi:hypothetical protein
VAERRRLPVIQEAPPPPGDAPGDDDARPPWHWVGFGTVAIFATWLILAAVAGAVVKRAIAPWVGAAQTPAEIASRLATMSADERMRLAAVQMIPHVFALALASFAGGLLVGKFGAGTGPREAAMSGFATALIATVVAVREGGVSWASAVTFLIAVAFSAWGGRVGARRKRSPSA